MPGIYSIVEGHGEERAAPRLFANILRNGLRKTDFYCWPPYRVSRGGIANLNNEMTTALATARTTISVAAGQGVLFVMLDADDDCAVTLSQGIRNAILRTGFPYPVSVVACVREYEAWFLIAAESLRGAANVRANASNVPHAENIRDAKGAVEKQILIQGRPYSPTVDQPEFSTRLDVLTALKSRSFTKLAKELDLAIHS